MGARTGEMVFLSNLLGKSREDWKWGGTILRLVEVE
jgi:hypothetical protein